MMMHRSVIAVAMLAGLVGTAHAACGCGGIAISVKDATTFLSGKMVCAAATDNADVWQEWHNGGVSGSLKDYKLGPDNAVDPSEVVGTYSIAAGPDSNAVVTYSYSGGKTYTYDVCVAATATDNTGVNFCSSSARSITNATVPLTMGLRACGPVIAGATATRRRR